jgi:hypothetical protein
MSNIINVEFDYSDKSVTEAAQALADYLADAFTEESGFVQGLFKNATFDLIEFQSELNKALASNAHLLRVWDVQQQNDSIILALRMADFHEVLGFF